MGKVIFNGSDALNRYLCASDSYQDFLSHHGILGQKWGVRRYQNPDGTLTEEGKKRYYSDGRSGKVLTKSGAKAVTKDLTKLSKLRSMDKIYGNDPDDPNADRYKKKYEAERAKFKTKWGEGQDGMIDWAREHPNAEKKLDKVFSKEDALDKPIEFKSKLGQRYQRNLEIQAKKAKEKEIDKVIVSNEKEISRLDIEYGKLQEKAWDAWQRGDKDKYNEYEAQKEAVTKKMDEHKRNISNAVLPYLGKEDTPGNRLNMIYEYNRKKS